MLTFKAFDALIFDMDGTLIDSERPIMAAFHETCASRGLPHQPDTFLALVGLPMTAGRVTLRAQLVGESDVDAFEEAWETAALRLNSPGIPLKPGALALLEYCAQERIPVAVATSTHSARAQQKLGAVSVLDHIAHIIGGEQVERGKPAPDIFLEAARRLNVSPERCIALEDSVIGVRAALAAGMTTVHIPDVLPYNQALIAAGALHAHSLTEVLARLQAARGRTP